MFAVGVLAFLFADIFEHAWDVEEPVEAFEEGEQGIGEAIVWSLCSAWASPPAQRGWHARALDAAGRAAPTVAAADHALTVRDAEIVDAGGEEREVRALRSG